MNPTKRFIEHSRNLCKYRKSNTAADSYIKIWNSSLVDDEPFIFHCASLSSPNCELFTINTSQVCETCARHSNRGVRVTEIEVHEIGLDKTKESIQ
jgi:hypothetical protein